jgi:Tol biopolymer transport system component
MVYKKTIALKLGSGTQRKNLRKSTVFLALFVLTPYAWGQWSEPVNLGPNINSPSFEFGHCLTPDEDTIYFATVRPGGRGGYDLWFSWKEKGEWVPAKNMGDSINTQWNENSPFLSPDRKFLYFSSTRPKGPGNYDIYITERKNGVWQIPICLTYPVNTRYSEGWPCLSLDGNQLYFSSDRPGGKGHLDIWMVAKKNGQWVNPVNLGDSINQAGWEGSSSISPDGKELYFRRDTVTQTRPAAIWRSVNRNGVWQKAEKLPPPVNGAVSRDASPFLSYDGKKLYFNSEREPSLGLSDIFVTEGRGGKP